MAAQPAPSNQSTIFVDSGAGQSVFGSTEAFLGGSLRPCDIQVEGIAGNISVTSVGTVRLLVKTREGEHLICLFHNVLRSSGCHDLLSVSQIHSGTSNHKVKFDNGSPTITIHRRGRSRRRGIYTVDLILQDGLYEFPGTPLSDNDSRLDSLPTIEMTPSGMFEPVHTTLWSRRVLVAPVTTLPLTFGEALSELSSSFVAPASIPPSRRKYCQGVPADMADLSVRFMGSGQDRLSHTIGVSKGLSKVPGKVPPIMFPQGKIKRGKVPLVSKSLVKNLHKAAIGEVVFTDTFQTSDVAYKYGQAFVDYRSRYGWVYPIASRKQVALSFSTFCANHFTPVILIRDNIGENIGGELIDECLRLSVQSAYICPHTPQQDYAEGYLGRVTSMASFAMVYSGAPLFMWRWAIVAATFLNNITASWYSEEKIWAQPYQLIHGEPFADSSIVMPWGCAVLVMLTPDEVSKFKSKCALMILAHYAIQHPLYTYAVYSPKTKRLVYRQDCIFITNVFPMRNARTAAAMDPDGNILDAYQISRSPLSMRESAPAELSFGEWDGVELPHYDDHTSGEYEEPEDECSIAPVPTAIQRPVDWPTRLPSHPLFGDSLVKVPTPPSLNFTPDAKSVKKVRFSEPPTEDNALSDEPDLDLQAASLVGSQFFDDELKWCTISAWGTNHGSHVLFYAPTVPNPKFPDVEHSSLAEVQAWIRRSPAIPESSALTSSRTIRRSPRLALKSSIRWYGPRVQVDPVLSGQLQSRARFDRGPHRMARLDNRPKSRDSKSLSQFRSSGFSLPASKKVLKAKTKESLYKFGVQVPRTDREAETFPDAIRWKAGRDLEWLRLKRMNTFDGSWTLSKIQDEFPGFEKKEIGHLFYVYDYKFSGERRVRCVYDGSRQSPTTYSDTYAPTVRPESIRFFHLYNVEHGLSIGQYDVPCAFLQSEADCDIFVYPPKGNGEHPGQILRLRKMLYGAKQSAYLWNKKLDTFLRSLGFETGSLDPCFYKRKEKGSDFFTTIILHCDDLRVGATPTVLKQIKDALFSEYAITSADGTRFLGMDVHYDLPKGVLTFSMGTYIKSTVDRFEKSDSSCFLEIVGCLLWAVLCVRGPELLRVKDLARRSHSFIPEDFQDAMAVLHRLNKEPDLGITFRRGGAGKERIPSAVRPQGRGVLDPEPYHVGSSEIINELGEDDLYLAPKEHSELEDLDANKDRVVSKLFTMVAYTDASFAVGPKKQSISGWIVMVNGVPMVWGSLKQTVVVDSSCSAEYVAASICMKQVKSVEAMISFLDINCSRPYPVYTDSQACKFIGDNTTKLGRVRHLDIRTHMVRCYISLGEVELIWCCTEEELADIFTKIVSSAQDDRLAHRFYNDCIFS